MSTVTHRVKKLIFANPMRMEISRFRSRFLNSTSSPVFNKALVAMLLICYLGIVGIVMSSRKDVSPSVVVIIQSITMLVLAPLCSYGLIAGEKDRRSWDLLQVAPVTFDQIVVGKFMGALTAMGAITLAFLPFIGIGALFGPVESMAGILNMELVALSAAALACAISLFLSARLKNANSALAVSIASLVGVLIVAPALLSALLEPMRLPVSDVLFCWHPVYVIFRIYTQTFPYRYNDEDMLRLIYGWPQVIGYLACTFFTLRATVKCLTRKAGKE